MQEQAGDPRPVAGPEPDGKRPIVGRDAELARLFHMVDSASADPALMLLGDVGMGKTALLDRAVRRAEASGARVLRAEGSESESSLAFAALHQLLRPVSADVDGLPLRQRAALHGAFGAGPATAEPDLMLIGVAVLSLLSALGDRGPVLVVLDDAQWLDRSSVDVLSFAARRLAGEPVTMLLAARVGDRVPGFDRHTPTLTLGPLDDAAAGRLLDLQPRRPTGRIRTQILDQSAGNPLALTELTRAATARYAAAARSGASAHAAATGHDAASAHDAVSARSAVSVRDAATGHSAVSGHNTATAHNTATVRSAASTHAAATAHNAAAGPPAVGPLRLTDHLEQIFAARLHDLPAPTRRALLLLAAMDTADSATVIPAVLPDTTTADAWSPAEQAGLVRRTGLELRFSHPLVRSAAYHAAPVEARRAAHLALAELLRDEPDRRVWHLAAAATPPDAAVSAQLERTADRARRRGGHAAAGPATRRGTRAARGQRPAAGRGRRGGRVHR
nr:ATP-binding protein [Streptomyces sp. 135]